MNKFDLATTFILIFSSIILVAVCLPAALYYERKNKDWKAMVCLSISHIITWTDVCIARTSALLGYRELILPYLLAALCVAALSGIYALTYSSYAWVWKVSVAVSLAIALGFFFWR